MNKESHLFLIADYQSSMLWRRVCRIRPSITSYFQDLQPILPLTTSQTLFTPPLLKNKPYLGPFGRKRSQSKLTWKISGEGFSESEDAEVPSPPWWWWWCVCSS